MKFEVEFSEVEIMLLQRILTDNADALAAWEVSNLSELVRLLTMHGADHSGDLVSTQCQGGEAVFL